MLKNHLKIALRNLLKQKGLAFIVVLATFIAAPIAAYFMNDWLQRFAYRIEIQWWMFALTGMIAIVLAFLTVGFQSLKAALANPSDSLKAE